jgi:hypothetical protein
MAAAERRKGERVTFERGFTAHMMGIDGTWRRDCVMEDVSETGAKLTVEGSVEGLHPEGILPAAVLHRPGLPPLRAGLGQWRSDRRQLPEAGRQEEEGGPARRRAGHGG